MGPMTGYRIIDLTTVLMGPFATQMLGEMGADIIKVEPPQGDVTRVLGPSRSPGMGALFLNTNRYKRSICLDLKQDAARKALLALVDTADVLVTNIRPEALSRLGLDRDEMLARNPKLIHAALLGFGNDGPYSGRPAYDDLIQAGCGLSSLIGQTQNDAPNYVPVALADRVVGITAVSAICAALAARERTGIGGPVEIPMLETMTSLVMGDHMAGRTFEPELPERAYQRLVSQHRKPYATKDGYISAIIYTDADWKKFLQATDMVDLPQRDPRFANFTARNADIDHVYAWLSGVFTSRTTCEWLTLLQDVGVPVAKVHDLDSLLQDEHLNATSFFRYLDHPTEGRIRTMAPCIRWPRQELPEDMPAPLKGEHSIAVLEEINWPQSEIDALTEMGALILAEAV
ncbi:MAG: CoA transferase [Alphaproteobacteria bacterium]|nr:MAG: CoA transferase [Alphaproteobacteria bacterium]